MKNLSTLVCTGICAITLIAQGNDRLVIDGSTTVGPIAKAFAEYFMEQNPSVNVTVSESGSGNGVRSLINNTCDIGILSRFMTENEFSAAVKNGITPIAHVVALDGLAVVVHPANRVTELTREQVRDIYLGKITNWNEVGGPDARIIVISRDTNSGTYETFENIVMNKEKMAEHVEYVGSNGAVLQRVSNTQGAIGYIGLGFVNREVKPLLIDGVEASPETIRSGLYPIARPLYFFTNGYPEFGSTLYRFVTLYLQREGHEIISAIGFIPTTRY